jgi:hypothetical protein
MPMRRSSAATNCAARRTSAACSGDGRDAQQLLQLFDETGCIALGEGDGGVWFCFHGVLPLVSSDYQPVRLIANLLGAIANPSVVLERVGTRARGAGGVSYCAMGWIFLLTQQKPASIVCE